jgi:hypothetical protein
VYKGSALAASIAALWLASSAVPAQASVTLGAVPATTPVNNCTNLREDWVQSGQISGPSYTVPNLAGTITSWRTQTSASGGQVWTFKVYRLVSDTTYKVVGLNGPQDLQPGVLNSFKTNIPVMPGDIIGMNDNDTTTPVSTSCGYVSTGNTISWHNGSLGNGEMAPFGSSVANRLLNVEATFTPESKFTVASVTRNRRRGTATVTVDLPNPGQLTASGAGFRIASAAGALNKPVGAGQTQLVVRAKGKKRRKLDRKGRCKINVAIAYTPTSGDSRTRHAKFKLIKR